MEFLTANERVGGSTSSYHFDKAGSQATCRLFCSPRGWSPLRAQGGPRRSDFEAHAFRLLQIGNDLKQVAGRRITVWAKHLMKSLYVDLGMRGQLGKADCGINVITQQLFAECHFAREKAFPRDRKSTRLNSSHDQISYAVFCLKKQITI